jgi:hypothetical protein
MWAVARPCLIAVGRDSRQELRVLWVFKNKLSSFAVKKKMVSSPNEHNIL